MKSVHQHPEGLIYVRVDGETYADTTENFARDFGVTLPPLPEGAIERIYDQGKRHAIQAEGDVIGGGDMPWQLGDQIIAGIGPALQLKQQRDEAAVAERWAAQKAAAEEQNRKMLEANRTK